MVNPLDGVRVLDLTRLLPGAVCTLLLAELGADVIKVEGPDGGDYGRWFPPLIDGLSAYFRATNHGKRSAIINLKSADGQAVLHRLAQSADVVVESFRPGALAKVNADAAALLALNPRLIYCSISGYGQTGERVHVSGHDLNYTAFGGLIGEMRTPQPLGGHVADVGGAYLAVSGILAALLRRERTGVGGVIDTALADAALPIVSWAWVEAAAQRFDPTASRGLLTGGYACYNVYRTADQQTVALAALEPKFWANFCTAIDRPDLIPDHTAPQRQPYLRAELEDLFAQRDRAAWDARLLPADCCYSPVPRPDELVSDPVMTERGILTTQPDGTPIVHSPLRLDGVTASAGHVPGYGEHTAAVLREAGYDDAAIAALISSGAVQTERNPS